MNNIKTFTSVSNNHMVVSHRNSILSYLLISQHCLIKVFNETDFSTKKSKPRYGFMFIFNILYSFFRQFQDKEGVKYSIW